MLEGNHALSERVLGALFRRGDLRRGSAVIDAFCNDERCASWLVERGWDFLDAGETHLVSTLLGRCPEAIYAGSGVLQAMHAWVAGLSGDGREACHIARHVLVMRQSAQRPDIARIAARIALAQFDDNAIISTERNELASETAPIDPIDFIACVLDSCTNVEVARAFRLDCSQDDVRYEKTRRAPGKQRARQLTALFTEHAERFGDSRAFRVALHVLAHVDSLSLIHIFVLCTTDPHKVPETIQSRCQRFDFRRFSVEEIVGYLERISKGEGFEYEPEALEFIAAKSAGGMRDATTALEQVGVYTEGKITLDEATRMFGQIDIAALFEIAGYIAQRDTRCV